jgi:hypothetical protein
MYIASLHNSAGNECITSQTFTLPMHSEFREQEQQQEEYIRPETYLQIYNKATKEFEKIKGAW